MRAKDVAFLTKVLANEAEHAAPGEAAGLLAAVGAMRVAIEERQPEADVTALVAVEDALAGRLYGMCRVCGGNASERAHFSDGMCGGCHDERAAPVPEVQSGPKSGAGAESARAWVAVEDGHEWNTVLGVFDSRKAAERYLKLRHPWLRGHIEEHAVKDADAAVREVLEIIECEHVDRPGAIVCPKCHTGQGDREEMAAALSMADNEGADG